VLKIQLPHTVQFSPAVDNDLCVAEETDPRGQLHSAEDDGLEAAP
jgi:hypothetical protein